MVGHLHDRPVVLHHQHGVPLVAQRLAGSRPAGPCRAGAGRWTARPGRTACPRGRCPAPWPGRCAAPRRRRGCRTAGRASGSRGPRRRRNRSRRSSSPHDLPATTASRSLEDEPVAGSAWASRTERRAHLVDAPAAHPHPQRLRRGAGCPRRPGTPGSRGSGSGRRGPGPCTSSSPATGRSRPRPGTPRPPPAPAGGAPRAAATRARPGGCRGGARTGAAPPAARR